MLHHATVEDIEKILDKRFNLEVLKQNISYCLDCICSDETVQLADTIAGGLTYEELLQTLISSKHELENKGERMIDNIKPEQTTEAPEGISLKDGIELDQETKAMMERVDGLIAERNMFLAVLITVLRMADPPEIHLLQNSLADAENYTVHLQVVPNGIIAKAVKVEDADRAEADSNEGSAPEKPQDGAESTNEQKEG